MPEPAYTFTLPSLHDDTVLDCRICHPGGSDSPPPSRQSRCAVLAHPYAPLGGSYDDPVVLSLTETLLQKGYVVGTFNFRWAWSSDSHWNHADGTATRGAGGSQGKTSWTGRAEIEDFASIIGFVVYYTRYLASIQLSESYEDLSSRSSAAGDHTGMDLILGGYSYGSLILARLPDIPEILQRLDDAVLGSSAAEIVLRARMLAKQTLQFARNTRRHTRGRSLQPEDAKALSSRAGRASPITIGGEETEPNERRPSRDTRRSVDVVRKSVEMPGKLKALITRRYSGKQQHTRQADDRSESHGRVTNAMPIVNVSYLLISPVVLPFTNALCPPGPPSIALDFRKWTNADTPGAGSALLQHPTLAVFGTQDAFTAKHRLRSWVQKQTQDSSRQDFLWKQIDGAGHFWREEGVMLALQQTMSAWADSSLC